MKKIFSIPEQIKVLKVYRSEWASEIQAGWWADICNSNKLLFELYEISGSIILALQDVEAGIYRDKMPITLVKNKLENLVKSKDFEDHVCLSEMGAGGVITASTQHHIRVMFEIIEFLTS